MKLYSDKMCLAASLSSKKGDIRAHIAFTPDNAASFAISAVLRMFSFLSSSLKPKSLLIPCLIVSPSNKTEANPIFDKINFKCSDKVVFPLADNPVNQITNGLLFCIIFKKMLYKFFHNLY